MPEVTDEVPATIRGTVADGFEPVREEFAALLRETPGHAAQVSVHAGERQVVDLWGGPGIEGDTLTGVFSSTKGAAYLAVALLIQAGELELDREVTAYWPEFGAEGKGAVTVRDLLSHRAGAIGTDRGFTVEELSDDRVVAERVAAHHPYWRPGCGFGYHALTIGALAGEVLRRITGRTMQQFYEEEIRAPHGIDFYMGLGEELEHRVAEVLPARLTPEERREAEASASAPDSLGGIAGNEHRPEQPPLAELPNQRCVRAGGPASVGGVGSARGLARLYAAAISGTGGRGPLLRPETAALVARPHSVGHDMVLGNHRCFGLGFMTGLPFLGAGSFGHDGAGGSMAFADPRTGLAFGYVRRRFPHPGGAGPDAERLSRAARRCVLG